MTTDSAELSADVARALQACLGPRESAFTLPPRCYRDDAVYQIERDRLFRRGWVGVGRSDRWPGPDTFVATEVADVPIIIVRGDDGRLRSFANSCRHRGSLVIEGEGSCKRLRCPFHAWTYANDGRLVGAPNMHRTDNFDRAELGLHEFATTEYAGFAFVSFEPSPAPIEICLAGFDDIHRPWNVGQLVMTRRREFTVDCNWKAFAEVFNEYYHLPYVHAGSIDNTYDEPDEPETVAGDWATQFGTTVATGGLLETDRAHKLAPMPGLHGRDADGVRYSWLFPNIVVATGVDAMWMYEVYPEGPHRTRCAQVICFPQASIDQPDFSVRAERYYERLDVAIEEDLPALVRQHNGLTSDYAAQGRFSWLEPTVATFARWYARRLLSR